MMMGEEQPVLLHAQLCEAYPLSLWCLRGGAPGANVNADIYVALGETSSLEGLDVEDARLRLPRNFHSSVLGHSCSATAGSSPSSAEQR